MDKYIVSARKYRPSVFSDVVGQKHVTDTLRNALLTGQISHAYLFSGPRGVGKTTCARILAKAVNCQNLKDNGDPCNQCNSCIAFNQGKSMNIFELDAASNNKVEDIRTLIEKVRFVPQTGKKSVYIIDEVHMLTTAAFNAFLKTLEEPPDHAIFIMATTEKHKILPTILSRCQQYDFKRIPVNLIVERLKFVAEQENINYEIDALQLIAIRADGAMRDALSIFDQLVNYTKKNLTYSAVKEQLNILDYNIFFDFTFATLQGNTKKALQIFHKVLNNGYEIQSFLNGLLKHFRNSLLLKETNDTSIIELSDIEQKEYTNFIQNIPKSFLINALNLTVDADTKFKLTSDKKTFIELLIIKLSHLYGLIQNINNVPDSIEKKNKLEPENENNLHNAVKEKVSEILSPKKNKYKILDINKLKLQNSNTTKTSPTNIKLSQEYIDKIIESLREKIADNPQAKQILEQVKFEYKKQGNEDRLYIILPSREFLKSYLPVINTFTRYVQKTINKENFPITRVFKHTIRHVKTKKDILTKDKAFEKIKQENEWINKLIEDFGLELNN